MNKKQMRINIKAKLSALEKTEYEQRCHRIAQHLYALPEWQQSDMVALTVSAPFEIDTWSIIRHVWMSGKKVCVPKCAPETKEMQFYLLSDFRELEKVYAGLYEPNPDKTIGISRDCIDFIIVPGLLFNENGYRIGFGGGYYDRFLPGFTGHTVSLAFSFQLSSDIPVESHDLPVQKVVTEEFVIKCVN
jgi:5-formyltetrahydrofolate cyclo-ligase